MRLIPLLLALGLVGCGFPEVTRLHYKDGDIVIANQRQVDDFCQRPGGKWDDGTYIKPGEHNAGCFDNATHEIWILNDCIGAESLPHELAHRDGIKNPEDAGYDWP